MSMASTLQHKTLQQKTLGSTMKKARRTRSPRTEEKSLRALLRAHKRIQQRIEEVLGMVQEQISKLERSRKRPQQDASKEDSASWGKDGGWNRGGQG